MPFRKVFLVTLRGLWWIGPFGCFQVLEDRTSQAWVTWLLSGQQRVPCDYLLGASTWGPNVSRAAGLSLWGCGTAMRPLHGSGGSRSQGSPLQQELEWKESLVLSGLCLGKYGRVTILELLQVGTSPEKAAGFRRAKYFRCLKHERELVWAT